ncbi:MAG: YfiM family protein [Bacteroidia bacterium]|nr:YfiM family protein [Bacteroidia bacterium]
MKKTITRFLYSLLIVILLNHNCLAQVKNTNDSTAISESKTNKNKLAIVLGTSTLTLAASYIYVQSVWWSKNDKDFHFDNGPDYLYAKNLDKCGHVMGGLITAELVHDAFKWTGLNDKKAFLYSFFLGTAMHTFIELKDGFAPTYGFSVGDLAAGTFGSSIPYLKYKFPKLKALNYKFSYYQHDRFFYNVPREGQADWIDDYMNHTYWLTLSVNDWLPKGSKVEKIWPDFLCIAGGFGVDNKLNNYYMGLNEKIYKGSGEYEYYVSLDIDWRKIIPQKTSGQIILARTLNYIKIPLPTLRLGPTSEFYWLFL